MAKSSGKSQVSLESLDFVIARLGKLKGAPPREVEGVLNEAIRSAAVTSPVVSPDCFCTRISPGEDPPVHVRFSPLYPYSLFDGTIERPVTFSPWIVAPPRVHHPS